MQNWEYTYFSAAGEQEPLMFRNHKDNMECLCESKQTNRKDNMEAWRINSEIGIVAMESDSDLDLFLEQAEKVGWSTVVICHCCLHLRGVYNLKL